MIDKKIERFISNIKDLNISHCIECIHWNQGTCVAFPDGVPDKILANEFIHNKPYPGQKNKVIFVPVGK